MTAGKTPTQHPTQPLNRLLGETSGAFADLGTFFTFSLGFNCPKPIFAPRDIFRFWPIRHLKRLILSPSDPGPFMKVIAAL